MFSKTVCIRVAFLVVLTSISGMRHGLGFMCDYFLICLHCAVAIVLLLRMGNEVSMAFLSSVQSAVSQTDTHTHTHTYKAHSYHLAGLCVRCKAAPTLG